MDALGSRAMEAAKEDGPEGGRPEGDKPWPPSKLGQQDWWQTVSHLQWVVAKDMASGAAELWQIWRSREQINCLKGRTKGIGTWTVMTSLLGVLREEFRSSRKGLMVAPGARAVTAEVRVDTSCWTEVKPVGQIVFGGMLTRCCRGCFSLAMYWAGQTWGTEEEGEDALT